VKLRFPIHILVSLILAALPWSSFAAVAGVAEAPFRFYTVLDGLTQSEVSDVVQDHAGYLWFTTARGLNRYDGKDFDHYTIADGLPINSLTALHVDANNAVWIGDKQGGITIMQGSRLVHVVEPISGHSAPIIDIEVIGQRTLAVVEGVGIVEIATEDREFRVSPVVGDQASGATKLAVVGTDVFAVAQSGLYRLNFSGEAKLELLDESIRRIHADMTGTLWAANADG
jgi:ligand-binding sensor domain-containing protein